MACFYDILWSTEIVWNDLFCLSLYPRIGYNTFTLVEKLSGDVTLLFGAVSFRGAIISEQLSMWLASISCTGGVSFNCKHICTWKHTRNTTTAIICHIKPCFMPGNHANNHFIYCSPHEAQLIAPKIISSESNWNRPHRVLYKLFKCILE